MKFFTVIILLLSVCMCAFKPVTPTVVETYGDSTMQGLIAPTMEISSNNEAAYAERILRKKKNVFIHNEAVSGTSAKQLLKGTDHVHSNWFSTMLNSDAKIIVINHGINDAGQKESVEEYKQILSELVDTALKTGKIVVLDSPNPVLYNGYNSHLVDFEKVERFSLAMQEVAESKHVYFCDQYSNILNKRMNTKEFIPDGIHGNEKLYETKGQKLAECLNKIGV